MSVRLFKLVKFLVFGTLLGMMLYSLCACSCESRMRCLLRHCPECFQRDTLTLRDTVPPDTVRFMEYLPWHLLTEGAPLLVEGLNYRLQLVADAEGLSLEGEAVTDTVFITRRVPVDRPVVVEKERQPSLWQWAVLTLLALFCLWGIVNTLIPKR